MFRHHPVLSVATFAYLALVGWITLSPDGAEAGDSPWLWRLLRFFARHDMTDWITYSRVEFTTNIFMFIPVGIFLLLLLGRRNWYAAILSGFALTCAIEFVQRYVPGRVSDPSDIVANTTGAAIGVFFALIATAPKARRLRAQARRRELATSRI